MWIKSYKGDLEACDCFGTPLVIGADIIYSNIDIVYKRPKIRTGVILDIDPEKGIQLTFNRWESQVKPDSQDKTYLELKPEDWERVEVESKVWLKTFEIDPVEPGKAIFENIYQQK